MYISYPAVFYKANDSEGYYVVFPDFDGGATEGDNEQEAFYMAQDWIGTMLYDNFVEKKEFPKASSIKDICLDPKEAEYAILEDSFVSLVGLDLAEYVKRVDKKVVKKTVTIPSYLNEMGKRMEVNFSKLLTDALKRELDMD